MRLSDHIKVCQELLAKEGDILVTSQPPELVQTHRTIGACLLNDAHSLLVFTCRPTTSQCEEFCKEFFPAWERMKEMGMKIVQVEIMEIV